MNKTYSYFLIACRGKAVRCFFPEHNRMTRERVKLIPYGFCLR